VQAGLWGCKSGVTVNGGSITVTAGTVFNTPIYNWGPSLRVQGDLVC